VAFFVGCVASFFPLVQKIPLAFVEILDKVGVDFTLLGGEKWCCGFPLIGAGMKKESEVLIQHHLEIVKENLTTMRKEVGIIPPPEEGVAVL
jgi:heterodisulfide reductase subunit D